MAEERAQRRLATILAADVVGYSRLMENNEDGTLADLKVRRREVLAPLVAKHQGRIFKMTGDGVLMEFGSAVGAVQCAVDLQHGMAAANVDQPTDRQIVLRIGVNLGDVIVEGSDLYGDGINIAARLEASAEPGGILVSSTVYDHVRNKVKVGFEDLGSQSLKGIAEPVRAYRVTGTPAVSIAPPGTSTDKPSIAVLPFTNMSGDPEQEYFSDGITEDIITDLSKVSTLNVLSRNTTFTFKGKAVEIGHIAQRLKVGYVIEGSVRKAGGRVRITAQLIDATRDTPVWAERFDRNLSDIFKLQDEIAQAIVAALKIKLLPAEAKSIEGRSTQNATAYQLYLLARYYQLQYNLRAQEIALRFGRRALEVDPHYARAWVLVASCQASLFIRGQSEESGLEAAQKALSLDSTLAEAYAVMGLVLAELDRPDEALRANEEALRLEPNSYDVQYWFGRTCLVLGRPQDALAHYERAAELLETDYFSLSLAAGIYHALGREDECRSTAARSLERLEREIAVHPDNANALALGATDLACVGEFERAEEWGLRSMTIDPDDPMNVYNVACAMAQMNKIDRALELLEACVGKMAAIRIERVKRDYDLVPLHNHPRYQALIAAGETRLAAVQAEEAAKAG